MQVPGAESGRRRSPFVAAFLSLLFPGLGQAYAGFAGRALAWASPVVLALALLGGMIASRASRDWLLARLTSPTVLLVVFGLNALLLAYRFVAVIDAHRCATAASAADARGGDFDDVPRARRLGPLLGRLGLAAVLLVAPMVHLVVARYDLLAYDLLTSITGKGPAVVVATETPGASGVQSPGASGGQGGPPVATATPWSGTGRLNVLLVGIDQRGDEQAFNTDTMIVASIDPASHAVALMSLPRDTIKVPLPASWPAHNAYAGGVYPDKINGLWLAAASSPRLYPFPGDASQRGFDALKGALGELYQISIPYYVEVNFYGFEQVVDTLGGVTVDVQSPVTDTHYPQPGGNALNLYIAPGIQHMNGAQALAYARSRHTSSDFDRAQRQQRVIVSLRQQTDPATVLANLDGLIAALKTAVHTDIPAELFPSLVGLADKVDLADVRSLVFTPPKFQLECAPADCATNYWLAPKVETIRAAVRDALRLDPALLAQRNKLQAEGATIDVLNGSGKPNQAQNVVDELNYLGFDAQIGTANGGQAPSLANPTTVITVYNGAEAELPETVRLLQATFGVTVVSGSDPAITTPDYILITTGAATPAFTVPSS